MARTVAGLPAGMRITDFVSVGVLASRIPRPEVDRVLTATGRHSQRVRQLPAQVMVYYVIALALYMEASYGEVLRMLVEGLRWLGAPAYRLRNTGRSAISQARTRLGSEPLERLYRDWVRPIASERTQGWQYRDWRLVSVDGTTLDTADTEANAAAFGRPGASRGTSAFPQVRLVSLLESGTRVLFGAQIGPCTTAEVTLADRALEHLSPGMLCLADRNFFAYAKMAGSGGARRGAVVAREENGRVALSPAVGGWLLPERGLPVGERPTAPPQRVRGPRHRIPARRGGGAGAPLPSGHHAARSHGRPRPRARRPLPGALGDRDRV